MQLKWGRGFFRAWAVVPVLWILFTGWNEYKNWIMHPDEARANVCWDRLAKWPDGKPFDAWDALGDDTPDGSSQEDQWRSKIRQKLAECEAPTSIQAKWEAELVSSDAVFVLSRLLLPPIALLVAGFIFGWIAKGFRTSG
jgi:hypothetical protein